MPIHSQKTHPCNKSTGNPKPRLALRSATAGKNRQRVQEVIHPAAIQARVRLSAPEGEAEQEAERTAEEVLRRLKVGDTLPRPPRIRGVSPSASLAFTATREVKSLSLSQGLMDLQHQGTSLPPALRREMEDQFGVDFGSVRVHTGQLAQSLAEGLGAHAFTHGEHIVFGAGEWSPSSPQGKKLLAHELTHVVQQRRGSGTQIQRWYVPGISEIVDAIGDVVDAAGRIIVSQAWRLVRRYAPGLEPILRQGPFEWLKGKVAGAFRSLLSVFQRINPIPRLQQMVTVFTGLFQRAGDIIQALVSGECGPLFTAMRQLRDFVTEVVGAAWDRLTDFLRPIGDFFANLWKGYGAPALEWIQRFAGDIWNGIQALARKIWRWLKPLRDRIAAVWNWVREQLFGPDERSGDSDSEGGLLGWIGRKVGEVWDWIKQHARPIWEPVRDTVQFVARLLPPAFLRELGQSMRGLSQNLNETSRQMGNGGSVAQNRRALASVLPSIGDILTLVRRQLVGGKNWLLGTIGHFAGGLRNLLRRLRSISLLSFLATLLGWFEQAASSMENWAGNIVSGLFDWLLRGLDFLTPFIQRLLTTVRRLIAVVTDLLRLPLLVAQSLWRAIPECIRKPIEDFLVNQILRRLPVFSSLLAIPNLWQRVQATAMRILRQVFVDGDLAGAAWTFFSSMLRLIGIPPGLVVSILAKAAGVVGDILLHPIDFLINLLRAVREGFGGFFDHFGQHMLSGIGGWLFGQVRQAGITPPREMTPRAVFGLVLQLLDITAERIFRRLGRRIGARNVERLRRMPELASGVWGWVRTLVTDGPVALWHEVRERLSDLWSRLVDGIVSWLSTHIISRVTARLMTMLDPSGIMAVINSLVALYRAIQSFIQHLREMLQIIDRVLDGIGGIVRGAIGVAAGALERALASSIPIAIDFLANQVGLGNLGRRIRDMVTAVRRRVDSAIDWLIARALRGGRAFLRLARSGAGIVRRGVARLRAWWRGEARFIAADGERHRVFIQGRDRHARLMIASVPQSYRRFVEALDIPPGKQRQKDSVLRIAGQLDAAIREAAASGGPQQMGMAGTEDPHAAVIEHLLEQLAAETASLIPVDNNRSTPPVYGPLRHGFGSSVRVERLTRLASDGQPIGSKGSAPSSSLTNPHWEALRLRKEGGSSFYVRGHLLNDNLGGPGNTWENLTPLTQQANNRGGASVSHLRGFEEPVKQAVLENGKKVNFVVTASYGRPLRTTEVADLENPENSTDEDRLIARIIRAEQYVPTQLNCQAVEIDGGAANASRFMRTFTVRNVDSRGRDIGTIPPQDYQVAGTERRREPVYLSNLSIDGLASLNGISVQMAQRLYTGDKPYRTWNQVYRVAHGIANGERVERETVSRFRSLVQATSGKKVLLYER